MHLHSIHFHVPLYAPTPSRSALLCCPDVVHLMRGRFSSSSYGLRVRPPTCPRHWWAEEEGIFPLPLSLHDRWVGGQPPILTTSELTHPHLCQRDWLYCAAQVRCRTYSPKCCSWWGQGQLFRSSSGVLKHYWKSVSWEVLKSPQVEKISSASWFMWTPYNVENRW